MTLNFVDQVFNVFLLLISMSFHGIASGFLLLIICALFCHCFSLFTISYLQFFCEWQLLRMRFVSITYYVLHFKRWCLKIYCMKCRLSAYYSSMEMMLDFLMVGDA